MARNKERKRTAIWGIWKDQSEWLFLHEGNWRTPGRFIKAWTNHVFVVQLSMEDTSIGQVAHLWVRRNDGLPVLWHELQRIKNELVGPERVGVEVFPAQSQLVDVAPMYHIWIYPEGYQLPFSL
jgi:hypothetical protein